MSIGHPGERDYQEVSDFNLAISSRMTMWKTGRCGGPNMLAILIVMLTITAGSSWAFAGEKSMHVDPQEMRMKAFEKKIDFDRALLKHVPSEKVVFNWKNVGIPDHLNGWKLVDQDYTVREGRRQREVWEWGYTKNSQGVGIEITSHKGGNQEALLAIRNLANRSSLAEPPFIKGPSDLGTFSLTLPDDFTLYWAYRDLSIKVESTDKDMALRTAYWLNSIAEAHRQPR
jgi:hypothetical protein